MSSTLAGILGLLLLGACGPTAPGEPDKGQVPILPDGGTGGGGSSPSPDPADAAPAQGEDNPTVECPADLPQNYGDLGTMSGTKNDLSGGPTVYIDLDGNGDFGDGEALVVQTVPGQGVFKDGLVPGSYAIEGADTDYQRCSLCVFMFADYPTGPPSLHLMAERGTVVIDSVDGDAISGRLDGVVFGPIEIDYDGETCGATEDPVCGNTICLGNSCGRQQRLDGCESGIERLSF